MNSPLPQHTEILLRKEDNAGTAPRAPLKEKFVAIYEAFFMRISQGLSPWAGNPSFWDELFLLKVNKNFFERCIAFTTEEQLILLKDNMRVLFTNCLQTLLDDNLIRVQHSLETLCILLQNVFKKKFANFPSEVINIITIETSDKQFKDLIFILGKLLLSDQEKIHELSLALLNIIATASENLNQNTLLEYFLLIDIFQPLLEAMKRTPSIESAHESLTLLTILINYRKFETQNKYRDQLTSLKSVEVFERITRVISELCRESNNVFLRVTNPQVGVVGRFVSWLYSSPTISSELSLNIPPQMGPIVLALYELAYSNPLFYQLLFLPVTKEESPQRDEALRIQTIQELFIFCSYVLSMNGPKDSKSLQFNKLILLTLLCLVENDKINQLLHHTTGLYSVKLFTKSKKGSPSGPRTAISIVMDLAIHFLKSNLNKNFSVDLCSTCLGVIHRILAFEKKNNLGLEYRWIELWHTLLRIIKHISVDDMYKRQEVLNLSIQVLLSSGEYDQLYYEIIRERKVVEDFCNLVDQVDMTGSILQHWANLVTIIMHFSVELDRFSLTTTLTEDLARKIIKSNYETLRLKFIDHLDHFRPFVENPQELIFFRQFLRLLIQEYRIQIHIHI